MEKAKKQISELLTSMREDLTADAPETDFSGRIFERSLTDLPEPSIAKKILLDAVRDNNLEAAVRAMRVIVDTEENALAILSEVEPEPSFLSTSLGYSHYRGWNALHFAAFQGSLSMVELIITGLKKKARNPSEISDLINIQTGPAYKLGSHGFETPLHLLIRGVRNMENWSEDRERILQIFIRYSLMEDLTSKFNASGDSIVDILRSMF